MAWKFDLTQATKLHSLGRLDYYDLGPLGLAPSMITGLFIEAAIPLQYAQLNSHMHVVSIFFRSDNFLFINHYVPEAAGFYLAAGDSNPEITIEMPHMTPEERQEFAMSLFALAAESTDEEGVVLNNAVGQLILNEINNRPLFTGISNRKEIVKRARRSVSRNRRA